LKTPNHNTFIPSGGNGKSQLQGLDDDCLADSQAMKVDDTNNHRPLSPPRDLTFPELPLTSTVGADYAAKIANDILIQADAMKFREFFVTLFFLLHATAIAEGEPWIPYTVSSHAQRQPSEIIKMFQDDIAGYIWVATDQGIVQYDGRIWKPLPEPHAVIEGFKSNASLKELWAYGPDGVWRYNGDKFVPKVFEPKLAETIRGMTIYQGKVWVYDAKRIWVYDEKTRFVEKKLDFERESEALTPTSIKGAQAHKRPRKSETWIKSVQEYGGILWIYGGKGIFQYNGNIFEKVNFISVRKRIDANRQLINEGRRRVDVLAEGLVLFDGIVWAVGRFVHRDLGNYGVFQYDKVKSEFIEVQQETEFDQENIKLTEKGDFLWAHGRFKVWRYDRQTEKFKPIPADPKSIDTGYLEKVAQTRDIEIDVYEKGVRAEHFWRDSRNRIWVSSQLQGIWLYTGEKFELKIAVKSIEGLEEFERVLFAYGERGIWRYDEKLKKFTPEPQMKGKEITGLKSLGGALWAYGDSDTVWQYSSNVRLKGVEGFFEAEGVNDKSWAYGEGGIWYSDNGGFIPIQETPPTRGLEFHDKLLWACGDEGIWCYTGKRYDKRLVKFDRHPTFDLVEFNDHLWAACGKNGIWRYEQVKGDKESRFEFTPIQGASGKELITYNGSILTYSDRAIFRYDGKAFQSIWEADDEIRGVYVDKREKETHRLWIYSSKGVSLYHNRDKITRMSSESANGLQSYQGRLFVYGDNGLIEFVGQEVEEITVDHIKHFSDERIHSLYIERGSNHLDKALWVATEKRIAKLEHTTNQWLFASYSLDSDSVKTVYVDPQGNLWFVSSKNHVKKIPIKTRPGIDVFELAANEVYRPSFNMTETLRIPYRTPVEFTAQGLSFKGHELRYQYKLEGKDREWSKLEPGKRGTELTFDKYPNLRHGNYTLKIRTVDADLMSSEIASVEFKIKPPWYLQPLRVILVFCGIILIAVVAIVGYEQVRKITRHLREREELEEEASAARKVQQGLLNDPPQIKGFEIEGYCSSILVGGDFYHFISLENSNHVLSVVVDAAGHGMPAALDAQAVYLHLKAIVNKQNISKPNEILAHLNGILYNQESNRIASVSICLVTIDKVRQQLHISRAGDCKAYQIINGDVKDISKHSLGNPLGVWSPAETEYSIRQVDISNDNLVIVCSDGLRNVIGQDPVFFTQINTASAKEALESIKESINRSKLRSNHAFDEGKADDITVICIKSGKARNER
jgi:serine phosphatase RsbU (regulator of sigma subunit)